MLAIILSWLIMSVVFFSIGDILISLYNKITNRNESYGLLDSLLLGMCFILVPVSLISFWLPANHYVLFSVLLVVLLYWWSRRDRFIDLFKGIGPSWSRFNKMEIIAFIIPIISLIVVIIWQVGVFDSLFYHQQNIRWNEEFSVVPGLGNLEDRFAFNSNYLLLSAVFSFRFLFGEAVYSLQSLLLVYVLCWILKEIFLSGYEVKRVLLLLVFTGYIFIFGYSLASTSTDAVPSIVSFYLITSLLLYPESVKKNILFYVCIPISLLTFKINILPLSLISLISVYYLYKIREYRPIIFSLVIACSVVIPWLIRNVIISGYLVFPFYELDFFSVDWKMPEHIAIQERDFIKSCGVIIMDIMMGQLSDSILTEYGFRNWVVNTIFLIVPILSPLFVLLAFIKKKFLNRIIYLVYLCSILILAIWYIGGPDPRFVGGVLFALFYLVLFLIFSEKQDRRVRIVGRSVITLFALLMVIWPIKRSIRFGEMFNLYNYTEGQRPVKDVFVRPYSYKELLKSSGMYIDKFHTYQFNDSVSVYMSESPEVLNGRYVCFDSPFPCTISITGVGIKYLDVTDIEARGESLQQGFKVKPDRVNN